MIEHPEREKFRHLIIDTLGNWYKWGGNSIMSGGDCSGHIGGLARSLGYKPSGWDMSAQSMHNECVNLRRPQVAMLGSLYFYGDSTTSIGHVTLAYDDLVAVGANRGARSVDTKAESDARCAGWQFCRPDYRDDHVATYLPAWWPWIRVATDELNVREMYGLSFQVMAVLKPGSVVTLNSPSTQEADDYNWASITAVDGIGNEWRGWVASEFLVI